jgi:hypothetical protein
VFCTGQERHRHNLLSAGTGATPAHESFLHPEFRSPDQVSPPTDLRVRIALLLVLLYAAASTVWWVRATEWRAGSGQDEVSTYERRFQELRPALPAGGVVGYLGHPDLTEVSTEQWAEAAHLHFRRLLLAQYSLAPALLIEGTEPELVIGNFDPGTRPPAPPGFQVMRDFGQGVVLFRRARP